MTKHTASVAAAVFALSTILVAQTQNAPASPAQAAKPAQADAKQVTVTGCLKPIDAPGIVATTIASNPQYMLINARIVTPGANTAAPAAAGAAAPPATTPATGSATYAIVAENLEELRPQVDHQVEIIGRLEPIPTAGRSGAVGTTGSASSPAERLRVDAVRQIAAGCTPAR